MGKDMKRDSFPREVIQNGHLMMLRKILNITVHQGVEIKATLTSCGPSAREGSKSSVWASMRAMQLSHSGEKQTDRPPHDTDFSRRSTADQWNWRFYC